MGKRGPKNSFTYVACPNGRCDMGGKMNGGNIVANGTYKTKNGAVRKYICKNCGIVFNDRTGTMVSDLRTKDETVVRALRLAVSGMSIRAISKELKVNQETISRWLVRAADHSDDVKAVLLKSKDITEEELENMWTYIREGDYKGWTAYQTASRASARPPARP